MTGKTVLVTGGIKIVIYSNKHVFQMATNYFFHFEGAGYIGCHCCVELLESGYHVIAIDNFSNV